MIKTPDFSVIEKLYSQKKEQFARFAALLKEYNARYNLTSITDDEGILYKHFYDSLAGIDCFERNAHVLEVGSGGGFPSLPLKIVREDLRFTLLESTGKKCEFLRTAVKELALDGVEVVNGRAEALAHETDYREKYDVCCARAVARLNTLSEYCLPFVKKGGVFLSYNGDAEEELQEAERAFTVLGGGKAECVSYELIGGYGKRTLVRVKKEKCTPPQYPRGQGKERKNPL